MKVRFTMKEAVERQDLIDSYRKWDALLPREQANVRRLRSRYIRRLADYQMRVGILHPNFGSSDRLAITQAQQACDETRACWLCAAECLIGSEG